MASKSVEEFLAKRQGPATVAELQFVKDMRNALSKGVGFSFMEAVTAIEFTDWVSSDVVLNKRELRPYRLSFYAEGPFTYKGPYWISGERISTKEGEFAGQKIIVMAVMARGIEHAKQIVGEAHDSKTIPLEWRFVELDPNPFSDRFPKEEWMQWPWPTEHEADSK